jgi:hypothetical protein
LFCGCADHVADKAPVEACIQYMRKIIETSTVVINRITTLDNIILRLREFRDTAIRCGGQRGFGIEGDTPGSQKVWLQVNLTSQAVLLKGRAPGLRSGGAIDNVSESGGRDLSASNRTSAPAASSVIELVKQLQNATNPADRRKLRAMLRKMGHKGGARTVEA